MNNPYQPPTSDIVVPDKKIRKSSIWFGYAVFISILTGLYGVAGFTQPEILLDSTSDTAWFVVMVVAVYGTFKYARSQKVKHRYKRFWKLFPYGYSIGILYQFIFKFDFRANLITILLFLVFYLPQAVALFHYSKMLEVLKDAPSPAPQRELLIHSLDDKRMNEIAIDLTGRRKQR